MQPLAILLMGPTATGKTDLALRLANEYPIEIISVDSGLIYKDMNIGTAKPSIAELSKVPHHLINIISPLETYSVASFISDAVKLIPEVISRGKLPVLVGGTMMYYNGLLNGISKLPEADVKIRKKIEDEAKLSSWDALHNKLKKIDPIAAAKIASADKQRISRALEVYYITGKPLSTMQLESKITLAKDKNIKFLPLAILPDNRKILHDRIASRFKKMLEDGFISEVEQLKHKYPNLTINYPSMRSVGYHQVWQYLDGETSIDELYELGVAATRQLAKRQITWLRGMDIINLATDDLNPTSLYNNLHYQVSTCLDLR
jgi:tRNA dimethylallyltransferase